MNNIRFFKRKEPTNESVATVLTCPECDCQELVLWIIEEKRCATCSECDSILDISDYALLPPVQTE